MSKTKLLLLSQKSLMTEHFERHAKTKQKQEMDMWCLAGNITISAHGRILVGECTHNKDNNKSNMSKTTDD